MYSSAVSDYGIELITDINGAVKISSVTGPSDGCGLHSGQEVLGVNGGWYNDIGSFNGAISTAHTLKAPLQVIVSRDSSETVQLTIEDGRSLGLQLKGNQPVFINRVDKGTLLYINITMLWCTVGSVASGAGLTPGCCILKINDENVVQCCHDNVVSLIKDAKGKDSVNVRIGVPFTEHLTRYQYESTNDSCMEVMRRTVESPYIYTVPAMVTIYSTVLYCTVCV